MVEPKRHIAIATSTRADWGLLRPLALALKERPDIRLSIIAANMHLLPRYGMTINDILSDGLEVAERVEMFDGDDADDSPLTRAHAMARCLDGTAQALERLRPDLLVLLGDRYEMLAVASAATLMRVPIAHIAGGEVSLGAIDDNIRHAITKLSALHLTATEQYRQRVIRMGEAPERVMNTGAIGVWNILNQPLMSHRELSDSLSFDVPSERRVIVTTFHPATLEEGDPGRQMQDVIDALTALPEEYRLVFTYPNNDAHGAAIIERLEALKRTADSRRVLVVKSLGSIRYLSLLQYAAAVVGNSSSGIVEVPSMGVPTVDIGSRQTGRMAAPSVIHCAPTRADIARALKEALSPEMQALASGRQNPYYQPDTLRKMLDVLTLTPIESLKSKPYFAV